MLKRCCQVLLSPWFFCALLSSTESTDVFARDIEPHRFDSDSSSENGVARGSGKVDYVVLLEVNGGPLLSSLARGISNEDAVDLARRAEEARADFLKNYPALNRLNPEPVHPLLAAWRMPLTAKWADALARKDGIGRVLPARAPVVGEMLSLLAPYLESPDDRNALPHDWRLIAPIPLGDGDCGAPPSSYANPTLTGSHGNDPAVFEENESIGDRNAISYVPGINGEPKPGEFPLVVIAHAKGRTFDQYKFLQQHLASHGFASVSFDYDNDVYGDKFQDILSSLLDGIYFQSPPQPSPLYGHCSHKVSLLGHSIGGGQVAGVAASGMLDYPNSWGIRLMSVIAFAPNPLFNDFFAKPLAPQGLLVIMASGDDDNGTNKPSSSGFLTYDRSGYNRNEYTFNGYYKNRFTKSFVYLKGGDHHFFSDETSHSVLRGIAHGYATAYLLWSLYDRHEFGPLFKYSQALPGADAVFQYSEGSWRRVLDNFEDPYSTWNSLGGKNEFNDIVAIVGDSQDLIDRSPHDTNVLSLQWDGGSPTVHFKLPLPFSFGTDYRDLRPFRHLSFRMGQEHISAQSDFNFQIRLVDGTSENQAVWLNDHGHVPVPFSGNAETDSPMNTVLIPLCAYDQVDLSQVVDISFEFESSTNHIQIDSLEFLK